MKRLLTREHVDALITCSDMRDAGRMSHGELITMHRAFEADPYEPDAAPGVYAHLDPPPDWHRVRAVLFGLAGLLALTIAVLASLFWQDAHP